MNGKKLRINSYAKINLSLNINGKTPIGYHLLDMVLGSVSLCDTVTIASRFDDQINVYYNGALSPFGDDTALKAAYALRAAFGCFGADIVIEKRLPVSGGLGGSGADAAAVLMGLDKLFDFSSRGLQMEKTALSVGSDVPYMLEGGFARVRGTGERVDKIDGFLPAEAVILYAKNGVNTAACYKKFDELSESGNCVLSDNLKLAEAVKKGDLNAATAQCGNALFVSACALNPHVKSAMAMLAERGAINTVMSGSGSCVVGFFKDRDCAEKAVSEINDPRFTAYRVNTLKRGLSID